MTDKAVQTNRRAQIGEFLQSRRARLDPDDLGLVGAARRRVPGLRREEVAQLAGVSTDYYVRLEQGRASNPSESVLQAVARVLQLDPIEREYLFELMRPAAAPTRATRPDRVRPAVRDLVEAIDPVPAFVLDRRLNVLAWNRMAAAVVTDWSQLPKAARNAARMTFLDPSAYEYYVDWDRVAQEIVGHLRLAAGHWPDDTLLTALVGELSMKSTDFRRLWARQEVRDKTYGEKQLRHPLVGPLTVSYQTLTLPEPGQQLVTYTVEPGSPSETSLRLLDTLSASGRRPAAAQTRREPAAARG